MDTLTSEVKEATAPEQASSPPAQAPEASSASPDKTPIYVWTEAGIEFLQEHSSPSYDPNNFHKKGFLLEYFFGGPRADYAITFR